MHSSIEYAQKNLSIFSLHEWINVLKSARRHNPYKVELLEHTDFVDLKALAKRLVTNRNKSENGSVNWLKIRALRVEKAHPDKIFFKTDFSEPNFDVLKQRKSKTQLKLKPAYSHQLPISKAKYNDLMNMIKEKIIPSQYTEFYSSLPADKDVVDCVPEQSDDE